MSSSAHVSQARLTLVQPTVPAANFRRRHRALSASFLLLVVMPLVLVGSYLYRFAADQYSSHLGYSVRAETVSAPVELFGGLAELAGSAPQDGNVLKAYLESQQLVENLQRTLGLGEVFSRPEADPVFAYDDSGTIEDLHDYWRRMVRVTHDTASGLIEVDVRAFTAADAQKIAMAILHESDALVERLSEVAQVDTTAFAREELDRAEGRLSAARAALQEFRSRTQIVDPSVDLQGRMGLLANLQQELASSLIDTDLLKQQTRAGDIRIGQAEARIKVIEARIRDERKKLGAGESGDEDYAAIVSTFERLAADRAFAEQSYTLALAAFDAAQAEARRKSRFLAVHIPPTRAESSVHPERLKLFGLTGFFLIALWSTGVLIYYSLRDRR